MKIRSLLKILEPLLDSSRSKQRQEMKSIRAVLRKLRAKERGLQERRLAAGEGADRADLSDQLDVVHAQRTKGVARLREIRADLRREGPSQHSATEVRPFSTE
jgi:hypothetical protein